MFYLHRNITPTVGYRLRRHLFLVIRILSVKVRSPEQKEDKYYKILTFRLIFAVSYVKQVSQNYGNWVDCFSTF